MDLSSHTGEALSFHSLDVLAVSKLLTDKLRQLETRQVLEITGP
jgi:hypothetical protein